MKKVMKQPLGQAKGRVMKAKASKAKGTKAKARLPCSEKATMIPTEKVKETQCTGIKSRMAKAKNKRVSDVVHKLQYTHPSKGLVKYSVPDLRYDLKWGYVKVRSTPVIKAPKKSAKSTRSSRSSRNSRSSGSSGPELKKLKLPCAATGVMTPTSKKPSCEGIRNRMKKCQGQQVAEVVGHMRYKHPAKRPDGTLLTYNLSDLRYDLKCAYLKVTRPKKSATTAQPAPRKPCSPATPVAREGREAQRQKMQKTGEKTVKKDKGQERQARSRTKPQVVQEEEEDLLASDAEILEVEEPVRSRPSRKRPTAPEPSIPSTTSDRPPPEEWPWA